MPGTVHLAKKMLLRDDPGKNIKSGQYILMGYSLEQQQLF